MVDIMILLILLAVAAFAFLRARKHFRGGGCCGSGSNTIHLRKKLEHPAIGETILTIDGMHCENCQARIENAINRLEGVACQVNLHKKIATVTYSQEISDDELKNIVEKMGYCVTAINHL